MKKRSKKNSKSNRRPATELPIVRLNVAGIDIGSRSHYVAGPVDEKGSPNVREFGTTTPQLQEMVDWLQEQGVVSVAMESTSTYWIPAYELLESSGIETLLVNARHISGVPGRQKTDVLDCQWIQLLHSRGLLNGSFRPDEAMCSIRGLKRQWSNFVEERTKAVQWMQKSLDQMNVCVHHAVTEVTGKTGMAIIRAIVAGERDPYILAAHRDKRCKKSLDEIAEHLVGTWRTEHLYNLEQALNHYDHLQNTIERYENKILEIIEQLQPAERKGLPVPPHPNERKERVTRQRGDHGRREALWRLSGVDVTRIDGINAKTAMVILTEIGLDLSSFQTEKKFLSWLRLTPRHGITGGKPIKSRKNAAGSTRIGAVLRMAALSLKSSKTALGAYYRRISRRKDAAVAVFATARKIAALVFRMLKFGQDYVDIGEQAYEQRFLEKRQAGLKSALESMGYTVLPKEATV